MEVFAPPVLKARDYDGRIVGIIRMDIVDPILIIQMSMCSC